MIGGTNRLAGAAQRHLPLKVGPMEQRTNQWWPDKGLHAVNLLDWTPACTALAAAWWKAGPAEPSSGSSAPLAALPIPRQLILKPDTWPLPAHAVDRWRARLRRGFKRAAPAGSCAAAAAVRRERPQGPCAPA